MEFWVLLFFLSYKARGMFPKVRKGEIVNNNYIIYIRTCLRLSISAPPLINIWIPLPETENDCSTTYSRTRDIDEAVPFLDY